MKRKTTDQHSDLFRAAWEMRLVDNSARSGKMGGLRPAIGRFRTHSHQVGFTSCPSHLPRRPTNRRRRTTRSRARRPRCKIARPRRQLANRTWEASGRFASRFIYTTCYTVSYGVVFPSVLLARAVPRNNIAVRGLVNGAQAAIQKVDAVRGAQSERPRRFDEKDERP